MSSIGERIKKLREDSGKLQKEVAADLGITTSSLGLYEIDYRKVPPELIVKLAKYFNTTTDYILGNTQDTKTDYLLGIDTKKEEKETSVFDKLTEEEKKIVERVALAFLEERKKNKK